MKERVNLKSALYQTLVGGMVTGTQVEGNHRAKGQRERKGEHNCNLPQQ